MNRTKVLFLCTGNSARSQMAEALLRKYGEDRFDVYSAGLDPQGIHPLTRQVMAEIGLNLEGQVSKNVREYLGKANFGYLITVCAHAEKNCPTTFLGVSHRLHWAFDDPASFKGTESEKLEKFREVRNLIDQRIRAWMGEIESSQLTGNLLG